MIKKVLDFNVNIVYTGITKPIHGRLTRDKAMRTNIPLSKSEMIMIMIIAALMVVFIMMLVRIKNIAGEDYIKHDYTVTDQEFHRLRLKHCGDHTFCYVSGYPGPRATFIDSKGRKGRFR